MTLRVKRLLPVWITRKIADMTNIIVDCESSGPCPMYGDLIEFAAVSETGERFKSERFPPLFEHFDTSAYTVLGITREEHKAFTGDVERAFVDFGVWLHDVTERGRRSVFWSDNLAYDWQWINWGFAHVGLPNPFGFSGRRIGDLYAGLTTNIRNANEWKRWRKTKHSHDPLDDAIGNMEAFLEIRERYKI
jgi:hypothetical protein